MKDNDIPEKSDFYKFGVNIPVPTVRLSNKQNSKVLNIIRN